MFFSDCAVDAVEDLFADFSYLGLRGDDESAGRFVCEVWFVVLASLLATYIYLTNRFHVAVRLFSNRLQMTSKCGKNKKVAHEAIASLMFLPHFHVLCDLFTEQTHGNMESICFIQ